MKAKAEVQVFQTVRLPCPVDTVGWSCIHGQPRNQRDPRVGVTRTLQAAWMLFGDTKTDIFSMSPKT